MSEPKKERTLEEMQQSADKYRQKKLGGGKTANFEPTEEGKSYLKQIREREKQQSDFSLEGLLNSAFGDNKRSAPLFKPYPVLNTDARILFDSILISELRRLNKTMLKEPENEEKINNLVAYFTGSEYTTLDLTKGIYLAGAVGRGKSIIMRALMKMCNVIEGQLHNAGKEYTSRRFTFHECKAIVGEVAETKSIASLKRFYTEQKCLDDIGAEDNYKLFGNNMDIISEILSHRYAKYQQTGLITHATSNLTPDKWRERYGERIESRMYEMFNVVALLGADKRRIK